MSAKHSENTDKIKINLKDYEEKINLLEEVKKIQELNISRDSLSNIS